MAERVLRQRNYIRELKVEKQQRMQAEEAGTLSFNIKMCLYIGSVKLMLLDRTSWTWKEAGRKKNAERRTATVKSCYHSPSTNDLCYVPQ
jgi:GTP cyclohydrolase III